MADESNPWGPPSENSTRNNVPTVASNLERLTMTDNTPPVNDISSKPYEVKPNPLQEPLSVPPLDTLTIKTDSLPGNGSKVAVADSHKPNELGPSSFLLNSPNSESDQERNKVPSGPGKWEPTEKSQTGARSSAINEASKAVVAATLTQSQTIHNIQNVFNETQKIAYVGLCYTLLYNYKKSRFRPYQKKALASYEKWSVDFMEKMFVYLEVLDAERFMIQNLAIHGVQPPDLAQSLIQDAKAAQEKYEEQEREKIQAEQEALDAGLPLPPTAASTERPVDIRFTILSHLFLLSISDGFYDARSRALLKRVAQLLEINWLDFVTIEKTIAEQLRIYEQEGHIKHNEDVVGERNRIDGRNRILFTGLATLAGGAVIGLTAGLAAPLIGAGIGAALTTFGVSGAAGVGTFMASTGGLALITTGGVLTGGGMSGAKMMKRTRGIEQFEFLSMEDAVRIIEMHRAERRLQRQKRLNQEASDAAKRVEEMKKEAEIQSSSRRSYDERSSGEWAKSTRTLSLDDSRKGSSKPAKSEAGASSLTKDPQTASPLQNPAVTESPPELPSDFGEAADDDRSGVSAPKTNEPAKSKQTNVLITIAGWVTHSDDDHSLPYTVLKPNLYGDHYTLIWETEVLKDLGSALKILVAEVASFMVTQGIQVLLLPALMAALTGPLWMLKLSYLLDNPWGNALTKAEKAGRVLADTLIGQVQGNRPVTLIGFSLGARVIFYCLLELKAKNAYGIVEAVYLLGCPVMANKKMWEDVTAVVSGRIVNGYCSNDMILGVLYRASSALWSDVAGLRPVEGVEGVESIELKEIVDGHLEYRYSLPLVLQRCGFTITADYFEDEEDEEEQARMEAEEEKAKINEQKLRQKEEKLKKRQAEFEQNLKAKQEEAEKARVLATSQKSFNEKESSSSSWGWFSRKKSASSPTTKSGSGLDLIHDVTGDMWQPKELKSTMPPLVIDSSKLQSTSSGRIPSATGDSADFDAKFDEAGLNTFADFDTTKTDSPFDAFILRGKSHASNLGAGDIADRKTDFEYHSEGEDDYHHGSKTPKSSGFASPASLRNLSTSRSVASFEDLAPPSASYAPKEKIRSGASSPKTPLQYQSTEPNPWT